MSSIHDITHAAPSDQPTSVCQITERLFPAYTIDGGTVHLAGCSLEDRVFLRLELHRDDGHTEIYVDQEGSPVDTSLVESLGMIETIRLAAPPESREPPLSKAIESATRLAEERLSGSGHVEMTSVTVLWCKYARGKLRFTVNERAIELPFSGWARLIEPPPFVCPHSGHSTFHLAATDDGRIMAAEAIEACQETGRRMPSDELVTCSATGRRVAAELVVPCPISGDPVLEDEMVYCGSCHEAVSPLAIQRNQCTACRKLLPVDKNDPRMARVLDEHPRLDRWSKWEMSETSDVYVLATTGWLKRLLVVVDKESLALKLMATGSRFVSGWQMVEPEQYEYVLND